MKISHGWLSEFVDLDPTVWTSERIATVLTDLGLEVEHVDDQARALRRFVVGHVLTCEKHPKADKLSVCTVDVGEAEPRTICCGAPNVAAGQYVPVALDGAIVPNGGFEIGRRKLRGVDSNGMICSQVELNLGDESDTSFAAFAGLDDPVFEIGITPNRADCNSHIGVARDLAAYQQCLVPSASFTVPGTQHPEQETRHQAPGTRHDPVSTGFVDPALAPRYALQRIRNVKVVPSPDWMQQRLLAVGLRPRKG